MLFVDSIAVRYGWGSARLALDGSAGDAHSTAIRAISVENFSGGSRA